MFPQESPQDSAITRDINRTFPAHDYFKDTGGDGQDSLYKICKVFQVQKQDSVLNGNSGSLKLCKRLTIQCNLYVMFKNTKKGEEFPLWLNRLMIQLVSVEALI